MDEKLRAPWMLAVWPGMGGVAISAGYYLMAKLGMHLLVEFPATEFFDLEQIEVKDGLILNKRLPRSRLFLWHDPRGRRDLILFIGEAQPPSRGGAFCRKLISRAKEFGVERVFTFAALATRMRPIHDSRVYGAAIDRSTLSDFRDLEMNVLETGTINGLNGVLLGLAAAGGLPGGCLLGEIPHVFSQIPFPKASLAVLESFSHLAGFDLDTAELRTHAKTVERTLEDFLNRMENAVHESPEHPAIPDIDPLSNTSKDRQYIDALFREAHIDRSRAYELKQELDRLGLFSEFEDRFLDLFKEP